MKICTGYAGGIRTTRTATEHDLERLKKLVNWKDIEKMINENPDAEIYAPMGSTLGSVNGNTWYTKKEG